jgi:hypothetical protein
MQTHYEKVADMKRRIDQYYKDNPDKIPPKPKSKHSNEEFEKINKKIAEKKRKALDR